MPRLSAARLMTPLRDSEVAGMRSLTLRTYEGYGGDMQIDITHL